MTYSGATQTNGASKIADLKDNIETLKEDASKLAGTLRGAAMEKVAEGRDHLEVVKDSAIERAQTVFTVVENQVRTRPAAALGITLGAGLLLGLMFAGRRH